MNPNLSGGLSDGREWGMPCWGLARYGRANWELREGNPEEGLDRGRR